MKITIRIFLVSAFLAFNHASAVVPIKEETSGKMESLNLLVPDGESFSNARSLWLQSAAKKCEFKEFKIIRYTESDKTYGDALSWNPVAAEYEAEEIPASVSGLFRCIPNS